jgi:hypothetical protein
MFATPISGLKLNGGNQAQALTNALAKLTAFSTNALAAVTPFGSDREGDLSITPDLTNNRLLLATPGYYLLLAQLAGIATGPADLTFQGVLGGNTALQPELSGECEAPLNSYTISVAPTGIPASVAANTTVDQALTGITGLLATDNLVAVGKAADQAGLLTLPGPGAQGGVTGAGAATIRYANCTTGSIVPTASETYSFQVTRPGRFNAFLMGFVNGLRTLANVQTGQTAQLSLELWAKASANVNITLEVGDFMALRVG